jgi:hypothetical protein
MRRALLIVLALPWLAASKCEDNDNTPACIADAPSSCTCYTGAPGVQVCNADGLGYSVCECLVDAGVGDAPAD